MDFERPVEAVIPGATGRLLAALTRIDTELPVSTLARVAGVGRTRASGILSDLHELGLVDRREIGRTTMVRLARGNAAGELVDRLGHLGTVVIDELRDFATSMDPPPLTLAVFGSFARGEAHSGSDIDVLAVHDRHVGDDWATALDDFVERTRKLTGNPVNVLDYPLDAFRRNARARAGRDFWKAVRRDAVILIGADLETLMSGDNVAPR